MPLDPETLAAIQEAVKSGIESSASSFDFKLESYKRESLKTLENYKKDLTEIIDKSFDNRFTEKLEPYQSNLKFIEEVKQEYEKELQQQGKEEDESETQKTNRRGKKTQIDEASEIEQRLKAEFEAKLAEDRKRVSELEAQLKADQEKARQEQEKAHTTTLRNEALQKIRESNLVSPGKEARLLALLEQDGKLVKTEQGFKIASKDKFGDDIQVDIPEVLPDLIKSSYDEYSIPRGGTGTGGQQGSRVSSAPTRDFSGMSAQEIYNQKNVLGSDLIKALEQSYQS